MSQAAPPPNTAPQQVPVNGGECPILVWMLALNREYTKEEYNQIYDLLKTCMPHVKITHNPTDANNMRSMLTDLLPLLMMRHRRIPRAKWKDCTTANGKHWIEQAPDNMSPEKFLYSMIGYHLAADHSLCGMAMTQGIQRKVTNIGLGIKRRSVETHGATVSEYVESQSHKLTKLELEIITAEKTDEAMLRRVCIILAMKQAYIKAIGQPIGFDFSRLEFNVPANTATGDGHPLQGWEFRIFEARLGVGRRVRPNEDKLILEDYHCVCAFFRGTLESNFIWYKSLKELEPWVQFLNLDQVMKVLPKLLA